MISRIKNKMKSLLGKNPPKRPPKQKVFCIGLNKTGTTSLEAELKRHGFRMGNQSAGEDLIEEWARRDFSKIIDLCNSADAFQDAPFSYPFTYQAIDMHFPDAKFVLTVRDDFEQWYRSLTQFHSKLWADGVRIPTAEDLKKAPYRYVGRAFRGIRLLFDTPESAPYEKSFLRHYYESHNKAVIDYFRHRKNRLLVINLSQPSAYKDFCLFLGLEPKGNEFPWLNKTSSK